MKYVYIYNFLCSLCYRLHVLIVLLLLTVNESCFCRRASERESKEGGGSSTEMEGVLKERC